MFWSRRRVDTMQALDDIAAGVGALRHQVEEIAKSQAAATELAESARSDIELREADLVRAWALVAGACDRVRAAVEDDRAEREDFIQRMRELAASSITRSTATAAASRTLGGSVFAVHDVDIDLEELAAEENELPAEHCGVPVQVWSLFDADWVSGFEICGKVECDDVVQFQVRRRSDGAVLPKLFAASDIRTLGPPANQLRLWTRV